MLDCALIVDRVARVHEQHARNRVHAVVGQDSQAVLLDAVRKIFAALVLNDRQEGDVRSLHGRVVDREQVEVVHVRLVCTVALPLVVAAVRAA
ncbi:hypothetical protein D3C71_1541560 [compost metagenome]